MLLGNQLTFMLVSASLAGAVFAGALAASGSHPAGITTRTLYVIATGTIVYAIYESLGTFLVGSGRSRVFALTYPIEGWGWTVAIIAVHQTSTLDPQKAVAGWLAAIVLGATIRVGSAVRIAGVGRPSVAEIRRLVTFGFPAWIGGLATFVSYRLDQVLMGFISTREQLGLYAVAVNGSEVLLYVAMATSIALTPAIAQSDPSVIRERALRACRMVSLLTVACSAVGLVTGPILLPIVFGQHNSGAVAPFMVLAASAVGWTTSVVLSSALLGAKASKLSSLGSLAALSRRGCPRHRADPAVRSARSGDRDRGGIRSSRLDVGLRVPPPLRRLDESVPPGAGGGLDARRGRDAFCARRLKRHAHVRSAP